MNTLAYDERFLIYDYSAFVTYLRSLLDYVNNCIGFVTPISI